MGQLALKLLLGHVREVAIAALLLFGVAAWRARERALVERGRALERVRVADSSLAALTPRLAQDAARFAHDTVRLVKTIERTTTLRDTLLTRLTDTLLVKEFVARVDTQTSVCTELKLTCAERGARADSIIDAQRTKLANLAIAQPRSCAVSNGAWALAAGAVTYGLTSLVRR